MKTNEERGFESAIRENPKDVATRLAYADWLEEQGRPYDALLQRVKGGISEARYRIRRKSDGLFSTGWPIQWTAKGKDWKRLGDVRTHFTGCSYYDEYADTPWSDIEVVVYEVRVQLAASLPVLREKLGGRAEVIVQEPEEGGG